MASPAQEPDEAAALSDLAARWRRARRAALASVLPAGTPIPEDDSELLQAALTADANQAARKTFENSLALGRGFRRFHGRVAQLSDLPWLSAELGFECLERAFRKDVRDEEALVALHPGCALAELGGGACDVAREAITGLVLGLAQEVLHSRFESRGHGAQRCVDAFFQSPESPARYGPIPSELEPVLERIQRTVHHLDTGISLRFLGVSDGVLHYEEKRSTESQVSVASVIQRNLTRDFPNLTTREVRPRAVLADTPI